MSDLRGRLRALGRDAGTADTAVTTCLVWVAGLLVEIAAELDDPRTTEALVDEASAVLAAAPGPGRSAAVPAEALTERELAVLRRLREEVPLRRIADDLFVSYNTVKSHTRAVYRKLGAHSRAEALHRARQRGLIR
ncbi:LuxR C-terminal-related transcriptional regulator [Streptomyces sp. NPDC007100]|uniref:helix-turn-helix transcriptional regulator n=1 Tax=unclassified Streptomyces TaxID=2593676 RepID=UPI0033EA393F